MKTLVGLWIIVQAQMMGKDMTAQFAAQSLEMTESSYVVRSGEAITDSGRLHFFEDANHLDIIGEEGPIKGQLLRTIFKYENDQLIICYNLQPDGVRPENFTATPENQFLLLTYTRKK